MITLYSGIPGSGKSYKMVAELSRQKDKYYVVHNIDGLKSDYLGDFGMRFIEYCDKEKIEVTEFFSKEYQIKFCAAVFEKYQRPVLVIIDEAHEWFGRTNNNLKMWLSYHRHIDQDIWLVAHRVTNIPQIYRSFIEIEYRAKSGSFMGVPGYFLYNRILGGQRAGYVKEKKNQEIFDLYQSQSITSKKKRKKPLFLLIVAVVFLCGLGMFFILPQVFMKKSSPEVKKVDSGEIKKSAVSSAADLAAAAKLKKELESADFEKKYRFVGVMAERLVLEDRLTGEQLTLEKIPGEHKMIEYVRDDTCLIYSRSSRLFFRLYNTSRYVAPNAQRNQSGAFGATVPNL